MASDVPESEMVERVARAIEAEMFRVQELSTERGIVTADRLARGAIAAMREPSELMTVYGYESVDMSRGASSCREAFDRAQTIWRAMIDAALAPKERARS